MKQHSKIKQIAAAECFLFMRYSEYLMSAVFSSNSAR